MRLVVLADTHMPRRGRHLADAVLRALAEANQILHLGDFTHIEMVRMLESLAPLRAVHGNNDSAEVRERFPESQRFELEGHVFRLLHGHTGGRTALAAARQVRDAEIVLFGHSHRAYQAHENGRLLFNPGSPTDPRWSPHPAFGLIELNGQSLDARIIPLV